MQTNTTRIRLLRSRIFLLLSAMLSVFGLSAQVTVTDINGVIYDVVTGKMEVKISKQNASQFKTQQVPIIIPATVVDVADSKVTDDPYTVVGMEMEAFKATAITSLTIEAPLTEIAANAFQACPNLSEVNLPTSVTRIMGYAFADCPSLVSVSGLDNLATLSGAAFLNCSSLRAISLPEGLTTLGTSAFEGCTALSSITIPSTLAQISARAFYNCASLSSVTLQEGLEQIGESAFGNCSVLKAPMFPASLTRIYSYGFTGCSSLGDLTLPANATLYQSVFSKCGITSIIWPVNPIVLNTGVFLEVSQLTSVEIPVWLTTIPQNTFSMCQDLTDIRFNEGLETISATAFSYCPNLASLDFPESLETIGESAFGNCTTLSSVKFPAEMTLIDKNAFYGTSQLKEITLPARANVNTSAFANRSLTAIHWPAQSMGLLTNPFGPQPEMTALSIPEWMTDIPANLCTSWTNLTNLTFSEGVANIGSSAFSSCISLQNVTLPSSIRTIGSSSFQNCNSMVSIEIPEGVESIGQNAFYTCSNLQSIELPSTLQTLGQQAFRDCRAMVSATFKAGLKEIPQLTFQDCLALEQLVLPSTLETLGDSSFSGCKKLTDVTLPESLKAIGGRAFYNCSSFGELTLPAGVSVGDWAFSSAGVSQINFPETECSFGSYCFQNNSLITEITFPQWMTIIPKGFCNVWSKLETIHLPDALTEIGPQAFVQCAKLHDVEFPESLVTIGDAAFMGCNCNNPKFGEVILSDGVTVGDQAFANTTVTRIIFRGCAEFLKDCFASVTTITEIAFPDCMTEIPDGFCKNWTALTNVTLPSELKSIGAEAFSKCSRLNSISFPDKLETVGASAFEQSGITSIDWPENPVTFGEKAFMSCNNLTEVEIPAWLNDIPASFMKGCAALTTLTWAPRGETVDSVHIGDNAFSGLGKLTTITFPDTKVALGTATFNGCSAATEIVWPQEEVILGKDSFYNCSSLTQVTVPDYVTEIPDNCFRQCKKLSDLTLSPNITSIGNYAFSNCALTGISWPDNITNLGQYAFASNPLTSVDIPGTITRPNQYCFANCDKLTSVTMNEGLEAIAQGMFYGDSSLQEVIFPSTVTESGYSAFYNCTSLRRVLLNEGLTQISAMSFLNTTSLEEITIPSTVTAVREDSFRSSGLKRVYNLAEKSTIYSKAFQLCTSLETFISEGQIERINEYAFSDCNSLTDFICPEGSWIGALERYAFSGCSSLKAFPYLSQTATFGTYVFRNCTSLTQMSFPETGSFTNTLPNASNIFDGDTSLESIIWPSANKYYRVTDGMINDAPLRALSYSYATGIIPIGQAGASIGKYTRETKYNVTTPEVSKLMVKRGERWKYIEAGYGNLFDIIEMKEPAFDIMGDIFSTYDATLNINHYKAFIRWEVPLSDLNADGITEVEIFRDGSKIGDLVFSQPETDPASGNIIVHVTLNGKPNSFAGDFDYPVVQSNGETVYVMEYGREDEQMTFDGVSHKRIGTFDAYGYTSWVTIVDEFDSPVLSDPDVPSQYTYTARMKGYSYSELVNNDGLLPGEDGLLYHTEQRSFDSIESAPCVMHTAMAMPSLEFDGLYTREQVMADTDHRLAATKPHYAGRGYSLTYELDPDIVKQRGRKANTSGLSYIVSEIKALEVASNGTTTEVGQRTVNGVATGTVAISASSIPEPGKRYQTITSTTYRGTFGSAILTVPDAPTLTDTYISVATTDHFKGNRPLHGHAVYKAITTTSPDCTPMGYDSQMAPEGEYFIGIWRTLESTLAQRPVNTNSIDDNDATFSEENLYHFGGRAQEGVTESDCGICHSDCNLLVGDGNILHTDIFDMNYGRRYNVNYKTRLYVKVPSNMLRASERWMAVDTDIAHEQAYVSAVEDVNADNFSPADIRWFDLQGRPVDTPVEGQTYIRVTPAGATKILY